MGLIDTYALRASDAQTAGSVTGTAVDLAKPGRELAVQLVVSDAATDTIDTLDVLVDTSFDGGATFVNIGHFTQVLGDGGAKTFIMSFCNANPGTSSVVDVSADASAGATRQIGWGSQLRYRATVVDADANGSFTYEVTAYVK